MKPRASTNINERLRRLVHGPPWTSMDLHGPPWISMEVNLTFVEGPRYTTRPRDRNTPLGGYMCIMVPGITKMIPCVFSIVCRLYLFGFPVHLSTSRSIPE